MIVSEKAQEVQNQIQFDEYKASPGSLGPYTTYMWNRDPRHLGFLMARYKFCAKMLEGRGRVLEIGCGDAFGVPTVLQTVDHVHGIDFEPLLMEDNRKRLAGKNCSFSVLDITKSKPEGRFEAAYALDVIEHVPPDREHLFFENICAALERTGAFIMGTPNITASTYASEASRIGHINLKSHSDIRQLMSRYFDNVFMFSMNDEIVHTGFGPMAHYLIGMAVGVKQ
jgi:cyclopropane fatty-acyl-phospholipid synthase-like methyltransferase